MNHREDAHVRPRAPPPAWRHNEVPNALRNGKLTDVWVADSGANRHMTPHIEWMYDVELINTQITTGLGQQSECVAIGKVNLTYTNKYGDVHNITLTDVMCVPNLITNLFSVSRVAISATSTINFINHTMEIRHPERGVIIEGKHVGTHYVYIIDCSVKSKTHIHTCPKG